MANKGKFIVLEGLDGSGKTTQMMLLAELMASKGFKVQTTFEPTDGPVGLLIRQALHKEIALPQETIAMLFAADRYQHVTGQLTQLLEEGCCVICDRYYFSNFVYQADETPVERLMMLNQPAMDLLRPDVTVFLDVPPEECVRRINEGREMQELYDSLEKLTKVREDYLAVFRMLDGRENIKIIPAQENKEATTQAIWAAVKEAVIP